MFALIVCLLALQSPRFQFEATLPFRGDPGRAAYLSLYFKSAERQRPEAIRILLEKVRTAKTPAERKNFRDHLLAMREAGETPRPILDVKTAKFEDVGYLEASGKPLSGEIKSLNDGFANTFIRLNVNGQDCVIRGQDVDGLKVGQAYVLKGCWHSMGKLEADVNGLDGPVLFQTFGRFTEEDLALDLAGLKLNAWTELDRVP